MEQLIEFLGAAALVERDFPQRAGSGSGERCVCCFKGFRRTTVCSAPASENIDTMFAETFDAGLRGIDPDRAKLYRICEENDVGITVMKGFAGGRLFDEKRSPFGVRLSPVQCITTR